MVKVTVNTYTADSLLLTSTSYADTLTPYTTTYKYDWRDRVLDVLSPANVVADYTYDNLGETLWTKTYASSDINNLLTGELRAKTENFYDSLGRVYESDVYEVAQADSISPAPAPGTPGDYLPTYFWYDNNGNVIKTETGGSSTGCSSRSTPTTRSDAFLLSTLAATRRASRSSPQARGPLPTV